jgi:hypothetical protein
MLCTLTCLIAVLSHFPIAPAAAHSIGFLGGVNLAKVSVDPDDGVDYQNRMGFAVGGVVELTLDDMASIQIEPMYIQKGTEVNVPGGGEGKFKVEYFALPAMVKFAFGSGSSRPYVMAGPEVAFNVSATFEDDTGAEVDIDEEVKSTDFGAGLGGGVDIAAGGNTVFVEGRYTAGFTKVNDDDSDEEIKTRGFQILGGITFPLGGGEGE